MRRIALTATLALTALPAAATGNLIVCGPAAIVSFAEGAPVDRIRIENHSRGPWVIDTLTVTLAGSAGQLVFDTVRGGAGVNVAQQFRVLSGGEMVLSRPAIGDGDESLTLMFEGFASGSRAVFGIDLDDRVTGYGGTSVSGGEIAGATVTVRFADPATGADQTETFEGRFESDGIAIAAAPCLS